ncbi:hypothetical protein R3P38DRAFT_2731235 [Favolaschia claudopus]|uniref:F-box domain-containing protein n=1 Tax=Favolaschia claudopus TaxID=2862362 RepID=A0AAW0A5B8_9AGAR
MNPSEHPQMSPESPFKSHLNTNYIPTDLEISQIRAHLLPHEAELARLDTLIRDLCAQRDRVKNYVESHKALISHPRRLPQDVLEEIFLACLPTAHNAVMSLSEPPLLLGRISSRWRSIAFALPRLWSSLHIHLEYVQWDEERVAAIDEWLERASPLPLSIYVHSSGGPGFNDDPAVVDILTRHSLYWSTLHLHKLSNEAVSSLAAENSPALSDIDIHFRDDFDEERPFLASRFLLGQKQRRISVVTVDPPSFVPTTPFTWSHITDLSLGCSLNEEHELFDMATAIRIFRGCPCLKSLKPPISVGVLESEIDLPLMVPSLESLRIETYTSASILLKAFFKSLVMPRLTKFHYVNRNPRSSSPMDPSVAEQFANHSPYISDVYLKLFSFSATSSILPGLRSFPGVTKLSLVLWTPNDDPTFVTDDDGNAAFAMLAHILAPDSPSNPVPALQDLSLETRVILEETWTEFLREHINHSSCLRRLHLKLWVDSPNDIPGSPDLAEFLDAGLDVSVDYEVDEVLYRATPWGGIDHEE